MGSGDRGGACGACLVAGVSGPLITAPGCYPGISNEDYHRNPNLAWGPTISSSGLKTLLNKSPLHYWFDSPLNPGRPAEADKAHFNVGKAVHDMLLLSDRWPEHYYVTPEDFNARKTKEQADYHAALADARERGLCVLSFDQAETVKAMAASLKNNPVASAALTAGDPEMTLVWQDQLTGVLLRVRPDHLPFSVQTKRDIMAVVDVKTAVDASHQAFSRAINNFGYHMSAALYADGIKAIFGHYPTHWLHVVIEKDPPYCVALYELPGEDIERGRALNRFAIDAYAKCIESGKWPGYADTPTQVGLPYWARKQIDEGNAPEGVAWAQSA